MERELTPDELSNAIASTALDPRLALAAKIAQGAQLTISPVATGALTTDGVTTVGYVLRNQAGDEAGAIVFRETASWMAFHDSMNGETVARAFRLELVSGHAVATALDTHDAGPTHDHEEETDVGVLRQALGGITICTYAKNQLIFQLACINDENPLGYAFRWETHVGTSPDPLHYSWRACFWGSAHACPLYDTNVYYPIVCGTQMPFHPGG